MKAGMTEMDLYKRTIIYEKGTDLIWSKRIMDPLELDPKYWYKRIKQDPILCRLVEISVYEEAKNTSLVENFLPNMPFYDGSGAKNLPIMGAVDAKGRIFFNNNGAIRFIQIIPPTSVPEEYRDDFTAYQANIIQYIYGTLIYQQKRRQKLAQIIRKEEQLRWDIATKKDELKLLLKEKEDMIKEVVQLKLDLSSADEQSEKIPNHTTNGVEVH